MDAQQARRVLDRLVGYKISPLLWDKVRRGLSAGRVQTVALRVIVEREREIRAFVKKEYWTVDVDLLAKANPVLSTRLIKANDETPELANQEATDSLVAQLAGVDYIVKSVATREKKRNPVAPFITSTLQQESSRKLRFSVKRTMMLAQRLYEGIEIGKEGAVGLITYMRTDSTRICDDAIADVRHYISERYGATSCRPRPTSTRARRTRRTRTKPSAPPPWPTRRKWSRQYLPEDEMKLYRLIWNRFVATPDDAGALRPDHDRRFGQGQERRGLHLPRHRQRPQVRRLPQGLPGRQRPDRRRRRGVEASPAGRLRRRDAAFRGHPARTAFHRTAAALQRSHSREAPGSRRRRTAFHVRDHPLHHSGARVRQ